MFDTSFVLFYNQGVKNVLHSFYSKGGIQVQNRIKEYREKKNISQGKLADLCNVSRQTINAIENNKYDPSLQLAFNIAKNLGVKVDNLFLNEGEDNK
ncbi:helix-turn-helix transcriptional regulator [Niallia sp. 01092]|uniref:helix-turn-helix transcriptional regulator n=1 Tax=unclassified Niallia TaxID=2837522 RepID=UPI003FD389AA